MNSRGESRVFVDGVPCGHPGCLAHISHPCEGCGRIGGRATRAVFGVDMATKEGVVAVLTDGVRFYKPEAGPTPKMINLDQPLGLVNVYRCKCGWELVTRDVDKGTTPMLIACRACSDFAQSQFYRVDQSLEHAAEWRKEMTPGEGYEEDPNMIHHRDMGGLFLHYLDGSKSGLRRIPAERIEDSGAWLGVPRRSKGFKQLKKGIYKL